MFDLFRSRAKAVRIFLGGILLLVAAAMVITLIPGFGAADFGASAQTLGDVAGEPITMTQLQQSVQAMTRGATFNPQQMMTMYPVALRTLVQERALLYEAQRLGLDVSDEDIAAAIRSIPAFTRDGQFIGIDEYRMLLQQNGTNPAEFERNLRKQIISNRLSAMVSRTVAISPEEVDASLRERNESITLKYAYIEPEKLMGQITPSEEDLKNFYAEVGNKVLLPEKRSFDVVRISGEQAASKIQVSMQEIEAYYNSNMESWRVEEQMKLRHILLATSGKSVPEKEALRMKAEQLLARLKSGADFAKLAQENSEDQSNASRGGDLDWIRRGQTVAPFEQAAFALKPGELSGVVESEFGFHIIKADDRREARVKPIEEVRDQIAGALIEQKALDVIQQTAERLRAQAVAKPDNLQQIVSQEPLASVASYQAVPVGGPAGNIAPNTPLRQDLNSISVGQVTAVSDIGAGQLAFAVLRNVEPARPASLEEARSRITDAVKNMQAGVQANRRLAEAKEAVDAGADLQQVARNMGLTFGEAPSFTRLEPAEGIGNVGEVYAAFDLPVGGTLEPFRSINRIYLVQVKEKKQVDLATLAAQREETRKQLLVVKAQERMQMYMDGLQARLQKEGKINVDNQKLLNIIAASGGS